LAAAAIPGDFPELFMSDDFCAKCRLNRLLAC
jgi:hypothetical protein